MKLKRARALILLLLVEASVARAAGEAPELIGLIRDTRVSEISGAAVSSQHSGRIFVVNDSQNGATLHVIAPDGEALDAVAVNDADNRDWEDLTAFTWRDQAYLAIADTGDNGGIRESLELIVVAEPDWPLPTSVDIAWRIQFRLPEGARDIEAIAVDGDSASIYLIAKRHFPRVLYRLPLKPDGVETIVMAQHVGTFNTLPPANSAEKKREPRFGRFRGDISAFALDPRGRYALVLSYRDLYYYPRSPDETLLESLSRKPQRLHIPAMPQPEAIALDAGSGQAIVLSERLLAPIYRVRIPRR